MRPDRLQTGSAESKHPAASALIVLAVALCAGCANPGPPKPPSLHLPGIAKDLVAERSGDQILLRWTTPSRTTDDSDIKGLITAELCREVGDRPLTPAARADACVQVQRLNVTPGPSQVVDTLPSTLQADPPALLTYRIQLFNAAGHSAGHSFAVYAASGAAPSPIESLSATASERGAILEWRSPPTLSATPSDLVDLKRVDLAILSAAPVAEKEKSAPARLPGQPKPAKSPKPEDEPPAELHLRASNSTSAAHSDTSGTIDATAVMGGTYTYSAERIRAVTIGRRSLEIHSVPSATVTLVMRDTFPPKVPTGLATISGVANPRADAIRAGLAYSGPASVPYIDLSWEPNAENDLAGYRVYRQLARPDGSPQGPLARLTALPIAAPAYRDVAVRPGQGYIYSVTAVDAAGNESAPSAKAMETIPPDAGSSLQ